MRKLLLLAAASWALACAKPQPYAPVKRRPCADCRVQKLPFNVPRRGLALGVGSIVDPRASWIVVDLDRDALNRLTTEFDIQSNTTNLLTRREEPVGRDERRRLIDLANAVWASDAAMPSDPTPDVVWVLYLFDGKDVRRDNGRGRPGGAAAPLEALLETPLSR